MNEEPEADADAPLNISIDLRPADTQHAISALRRYLDLMEQQMPLVQASQMESLRAERPPGNEEEEQSLFRNELDYLEPLFEEDLVPTMRYSFIVFLHTVLETRLSAFCNAMQQERNLPLDLGEVRGKGIDQARLYLRKLVGIAVGEFAEWPHLRIFQSVRNCIVHSYGYLDPNGSHHKQLRELAGKQVGLSISQDERLALDASFCKQHLEHISTFFKRLFVEAGWKA